MASKPCTFGGQAQIQYGPGSLSLRVTQQLYFDDAPSVAHGGWFVNLLRAVFIARAWAVF
jgi:hypothetical protein